ncbi:MULTISPECIES: DUF1097 domain-containing protein [unclassified Pseudomonas]|uniref:DUF1097 domain-containing protein n=1 Tax=unclassified Pseudomonas TaxID=196821 RepID=UPI000F6C5730|nr:MULTISPECIES: DUF1097 domain-containing protein [unclassified Pseudomonas]AZF45528.1 hypothetical protein C4J86_0260 [Pseudomonas sp. R2-7-07]AZF56166.1 hypothetical protein C4J84_0257 [Pseudomonas sp. R11-23-07]
MNHANSAAQPRSQSKWAFTLATAIAAVMAAVAAGTSGMLTLPVWAMFVGWVAFFSRGLTLRHGLANLGCVWMGIAFGLLAALGIGALNPALGAWALPTVVFIVAMVVVSLRAVPVMNNILSYFLGLIAYFASHLEPSLESVAELGGASSLGAFAGWLSHAVQQRLARHA